LSSGEPFVPAITTETAAVDRPAEALMHGLSTGFVHRPQIDS
jgi:hypothetical protein